MVTPDVIINASAIVEKLLAEEDTLTWKSRYQGADVFTGQFGPSRMSTLMDDLIPDDIHQMIMSNIDEDTKRRMKFIQIQRYKPGDYILPHKDNYIFLRLFTLTTSRLNGLTIETDEGYKFVEDVAGQEILVPRGKWHWVNPVREDTRFSLVVGR